MDSKTAEYISSMLPESAKSSPVLWATGISALCLVVLTQLFKRNSKSSSLPLPPRQNEWPLLGNIAITQDMKSLSENSGSSGLTRSRVFGSDIVLVKSPELSAKAFNNVGTLTEISTLPTMLAVLGDDSIICLSGAKHKAIRSALLPCFQRRNLEPAAAKIVQNIAGFLAKWTSGTFESRELRGLALNNGLALLGYDVSKLTPEHRQGLLNAAAATTEAFFSVQIDLGKYSAFGRGLLARKLLESTMRDILHARMAEKDSNNGDFLSRLIEARAADPESLTEEVLVQNMSTFLGASFDTMASALTSILVGLCDNPDIQEKCVQYIHKTLDNDDVEISDEGAMSREDWDRLTYIDQVVKECLRQFPVVVIVNGHIAKKDFQLGDYMIKKGTSLMADNWARNHDPRYWTNPSTFDPSRFDPERAENKRVKMQSLHFGNGAKRCIGAGFAELQLRIFTTTLLRKYKVSYKEPGHRPKMVYRSTLEADGPLHFRLERR